MSAIAAQGVKTQSRWTVRAVVVARPAAAYLGIAYGLSWAYWIPLALGGQRVVPGVGWPTQMPGLTGPALAAIIVTGLIGGRSGLADLWHRMTRWRVGWPWLGVVAVLVAGAIGLAITGGVKDVADLTLYNGVSASLGPLATIAVVFLLNGVGEEVGWRGFLVDRLLQRHSLVVTSLLVALVWAPWHIPVFFSVTSMSAFTAAQLVGWVIGLTAGSVVLTWLYRGSNRSILLVVVWHVAFNFTSATTAGNGVVAAISSTVVMVAAVAIISNEWRHRVTGSPVLDPEEPTSHRPARDGRATA